VHSLLELFGLEPSLDCGLAQPLRNRFPVSVGGPE
jgi:hypothetical protein